MRKFFLFLLFVSPPFLSSAQEGHLKGFVLNHDTKESIVGANIYEVIQKNNGVVTDVNGAFEINLAAGEHTLICSFLGMVSDTFKIVMEDKITSVYNILLVPQLNYLNVVVVSAGKYEQRIEDITVSMEVIKPKLIENRNTVNITSVLEQIPGLNILDQEPQIRGGSGFSFGVGSRVATLIDGLPILSGDAGRTEWQFIPVENIEQVEVIKGASSVLYGSSALSGTINFRTAYPKERYHTYFRTYGGLYDAPKNKDAKWWNGPANFSGINFQHSEKLNQFDFVLGGNAVYDHGYIGPPVNVAALPFQDTSITWNDVASRWGRVNFNTRYRFKEIDGLAVGINGNFMQSHSNFSLVWGNDSNGIYGSFPKTMTLTDSKLFYIDPFVNFKSRGGMAHSLKARIFYTENNNGNNQSNKSNVYIAEYRFYKELSSIEGLNITGGIYMNQVFSHAELYAGSGNPDNRLENWAAYTQLDKKIKKVLTLSAGFRGEYFQINKTENVIKPVMRAGLNLKLGQATFLRYSYGQGYRYPTITEKYIQTSTGGIFVFANPEIQPETSWNSEVGLKQGIKIGKFFAFADAAAFWQEYKNTIEYIYAIWRPDSAGFKFVNTGETRVRGIEFSLMGEGNLLKNLSVSILGGYTYTLPQSVDPDYVFAVDSPSTGFIQTPMSYSNTSTDTTDNILKYRFKQLAKADIEVTWKFISLGYSVRYYSFMTNIDKTFYDLDQPYLLPTGIKSYRTNHGNGAVVQDARFSIKIKRVFKTSFIMNNIFNLEYSLRPLKIESPRTYAVQLSAEF